MLGLSVCFWNYDRTMPMVDGRVVIDEWAGYLITVILLPGTWQWLLAAFFVFRFFDIVKPPPANGLQRLKGGTGIMIDDMIAGLYGCILLHAARWTLIALGYAA